MHKIAIVTVVMNFNNSEKFIASLVAQTDKDFHLYIADIQGTEDTPRIPFSNVTILKRKNNGYAYGINEGIKQAQKDGIQLYCVLNDDIYFENDFIKNAKKSLSTHPASIIGGKIFYGAGFEYHKTRYAKKDQGKVLWYAGGTIDWAHSQAIHRGVDEVDAGQYDNPETTGFITGCLLLLDSEVIKKIGYMDESYFLYYEDTDYCMRAKRAGITLYYNPALVIWHMVSQSTGGSGSSLHAHYQRKNLVKFAMRYAPLRTKFHILKNYLLFKMKGQQK